MGIVHLRDETEMELDPKGAGGSEAAEGRGGNIACPQPVPSSALVIPPCLNRRMQGRRT